MIAWGPQLRHMTRYHNLNGRSQVAAYMLGSDRITIVYHSGESRVFTYLSAGPGNVEQMKSLAVAGKGLWQFIQERVKERYDRGAQ